MKEIYNDKLKRLNEDEFMVKAIEELFNISIENNKPNTEGSDSEVGQNYKAYVVAKDLISKAFGELKNFKYTKKPKPTKNRAK